MTLRIKLRRRKKNLGFHTLTYAGIPTVSSTAWGSYPTLTTVGTAPTATYYSSGRARPYTTTISSGSTLTLGEMEKAYEGAKLTGVYIDEYDAKI